MRRLTKLVFAMLAGVALLGEATDALGQLEARSVIPTSYLNNIVVADFNHDGNMDFAVASYYNNRYPKGIQVFLGKGDATFKPPVVYPVENGAGPLALADLNHDGKVDIVALTGEPPATNILLGNGDGTFQPPRTSCHTLSSSGGGVGRFQWRRQPRHRYDQSV